MTFFTFFCFTRVLLLRTQGQKSRQENPDLGSRDRLNELTGATFDKAYFDGMVKAHTKDVSAFQQASKNAKDAE